MVHISSFFVSQLLFLSAAMASARTAVAAVTSEATGVPTAVSSVQADTHGTLPQVVITTQTAPNAQEKVSAHLKAGGYDGPIGIKLRGNSSLSFNQKKYTIETRDENGKELAVSLLGMPAHSKWVLLAPYNDVSMMRDPLAFQLWRDMGHWGPRTVMVELYVDGDYRGIYILCEAIKRGVDRVNVSKLKKTDVSGRELTGGYLLRIDTYNDDDATFDSKLPGIGEGLMSSRVVWSCIYPKKKNLQPEQLAYIESYVDTVEQVIQSDYFADPERGYACYIDVPSFVDYFIHTELSLNADGYKRSAYFYKEKQKADGTGGKLVAGPVWDYNLAYGNCNFCNANNREAWCFEGCSTNPTPALWQRLLQDPQFRRVVKQRYFQLRKGVLSLDSLNAFIDRQAALLSPVASP
jgi:spore coat protein CotH